MYKYPMYALLIFIVCSCSSDDNESAPIVDPKECEPDSVIVHSHFDHQKSVTKFGYNLFKELIEAEEGNVVLSPISVYSALLLAYEGSACETREQIKKSLAINEDVFVDAAINYSQFMESLIPRSEASLTYANALFSDPNRIDILDSYTEQLQINYGAEANELDFTADAVDKINSWAAENTNNKIRKVLDQISQEEVAFLLNAIYFQGDWENGFIENPLAQINFLLSNGNSVMVPAMGHDGMRLTHTSTNFHIVDMPLKGGEYAVSFIGANTDSDINQLLKAEDFESQYANLLDNLEEKRILLSMPKFELQGKLKLKDILNQMGIQNAFSESEADFSRMGSGNIFLTKVLHDTYLKVDEKGIEGAAVTTVGVGITSVPPSITYDKAYAVILRHKASVVPVFICRIANPLD